MTALRSLTGPMPFQTAFYALGKGRALPARRRLNPEVSGPTPGHTALTTADRSVTVANSAGLPTITNRLRGRSVGAWVQVARPPGHGRHRPRSSTRRWWRESIAVPWRRPWILSRRCPDLRPHSGANAAVTGRGERMRASGPVHCGVRPPHAQPLISSMKTSSSQRVWRAASRRSRSCSKDSRGRLTKATSIWSPSAAVAAQSIGPTRPSVISPFPWMRKSRLPHRPPVSVHTLRHCYAPHLLEAGVNPRVIQRHMGHASLESTRLYLHPTHKGTEAAYALIDQVMEGL
jgi:Phage integrase family